MPLLLRPEEAAKELSIPRTALFGLLSSGRLSSLKVGKRRLVPVEALREFVEREREVQGQTAHA